MFAQLTRPDVWRALLAGLGYAALYALTSQLVWRMARWLSAQPRPSAVRLQRWRGWTWLGQLGSAVGTLAYASALALVGVLAASDLGIGPFNWSTAPWVLGIIGGATLWLSVLWILAAKRKTAQPLTRSWAEWLLPSLTHEGHAAIWRAALMPWLGSYWGIWLAVPCKWLTMLANPAQRGSDDTTVLLGYALDCVGAALFFYSHSVWAAAAGRVVCGSLVWLVLKVRSRAI